MKYLLWAILGLALMVSGVWFTIWSITNYHWGYTFLAVSGIWTGAVMMKNGWGHYKLEEVISRLSKTIELEPNLAFAYFERAKVYFMKGKMELSIEDLNTCVKLSKNSELTENAKQALADIQIQAITK